MPSGSTRGIVLEQEALLLGNTGVVGGFGSEPRLARLAIPYYGT